MAHFSTYPQRKHAFMQKILTLTSLFAIMLFSSFKTFDGIDEVIYSLRNGNISELSKYIDDSVDITLPDKSDSYSKAQATMILRDFFSSNGVKGFEVKHKGDNGGNQFCIGTLNTFSGSYRTTIFMKTKNGRQVLKEIRFEAK
ncbi:MAG: DUF4783 domain-containing protein [Chitinophagaceae bacterium]